MAPSALGPFLPVAVWGDGHPDMLNSSLQPLGWFICNPAEFQVIFKATRCQARHAALQQEAMVAALRAEVTSGPCFMRFPPPCTTKSRKRNQRVIMAVGLLSEFVPPLWADGPAKALV